MTINSYAIAAQANMFIAMENSCEPWMLLSLMSRCMKTYPLMDDNHGQPAAQQGEGWQRSDVRPQPKKRPSRQLLPFYSIAMLSPAIIMAGGSLKNMSCFEDQQLDEFVVHERQIISSDAPNYANESNQDIFVLWIIPTNKKVLIQDNAASKIIWGATPFFGEFLMGHDSKDDYQMRTAHFFVIPWVHDAKIVDVSLKMKHYHNEGGLLASRLSGWGRHQEAQGMVIRVAHHFKWVYVFEMPNRKRGNKDHENCPFKKGSV
ncbi:hypothetical protein HYALB_00003828 [Hymenoscyphus albidus]|uniref:Uncharacterized protein n=1 Tax=Hymenoscyphus albidus TaxID=595503 RepID=A0A9N9LU09_9HELO|nr:hypothetical protein HYALB_00003828 [Hymenoscyphus albidus]